MFGDGVSVDAGGVQDEAGVVQAPEHRGPETAGGEDDEEGEDQEGPAAEDVHYLLR